MKSIDLTPDEIDQIQTLISEFKHKYGSAVNPNFLERACYYACFLPFRVQQLYRELKVENDHSGITVLKGFQVHIDQPTPESWDYEDSYAPSLDIDFLAVLTCSCVGHPFGWATQQKGKIIHDLIPQKNKGAAQTGYGSTSELLMHTEDSFHDYRAEFVAMYGIRNNDLVPTTFSSIRELELSEEVKTVLYTKLFKLKPDESHLDKSQSSHTAQSEIKDEDSMIATLYGDRNFPYLCYDPAYTNFSEIDADLREVYRILEQQIQLKIRDISIAPGDICIIDNRKVVHGRRPFTPNFDGLDRWLKRINITTNLRKSAKERIVIKSKIIG
jgi:Fe(II)/alpha-ketoglutarate-dependent arginine beta-hydroxylase